MATRQQVIQAYNQLNEKYAKTLSALVDALDELDKKPTEIEVEKIVEVEADIDINLDPSDEVTALEQKIASRNETR